MRAALLPRALLALYSALLFLAPGAHALGPEGALDGRQWELVSPTNKNGGEVSLPGPGAGALQAAVGGGAIAFGSAASFGEAEGAAPQSQYLASRSSGGWVTQNLTPPLLSGTYAGGAYLLFSEDLSRALLANGWRCRDGGSQCEAENPPLGEGAPLGYRNLYLRDFASGKYTPLITTANSPALTLAPEDFQLSLAGATAELHQALISTCAALTPAALEVPGASGCDPAAQNLYLWSDGALQALNLLPGQAETDPGALPAAPAGAISTDGSRTYWQGADGNLYLRQEGSTIQVDEDAGGGGAFQAASSDGQIAYFTKAGHVYRFSAQSTEAVDLTPGGEVLGVLGASTDGSYLYYLTSAGLFAWHSGIATKAAATADPSNYPPASGTARLSAAGTRLAFLSSASLTGYPNNGHAEAFVYQAPEKKLFCASCNPKGAAASGPAALPGALFAGEGGALPYRPRSLSADGSRLFFESADALLAADTDKAQDVYQWQAKGSGQCEKAAGCLGLVSGGRSGASSFLDASAAGADAFFLTDSSLLPADPDSLDVYDARAGGGFAEASAPIPCVGDACQGPVSVPEAPPPATALFSGRGNPAPPRARKRHCTKRQRQRAKPRRCAKGKHAKRGNGR